MEVSCPEKTPAGRRKAIEKLRKGFEHAKQLQILINKSSSGNNETSSMDSSSVDLLDMISNSFSYAISFFNNVEFTEANQSPASMPGRNSDFSEGSSKSTAKVKGRRGCYKRRKTEETWSTESANWEDGHAWRKYGQKVIHNHKYPRSYYRCTHKSDGCPATKQVQQISDDPPIHRTTYHGNHTCQDFLNPSQTILEDDSAVEGYSSVLLSFDNCNHLTNKQEDDNEVNPLFSSSLLSVKQEQNVDYDVVPHINQSKSSDCLFSPDELITFGSSLLYDHVDVISCTASTLDHHHNFDMRSIDHFEDDVLKQYGFELL